MKTIKQPCEIIMWQSIKNNMHGIIEDNDNNNGYVFGVNLLNEDDHTEIIDVEWFKSEDEREMSIEKYNLEIINEVY